MTAHDWLDTALWVGLGAAVVASWLFAQRAAHWRRIAELQETRANEKVEREDERAQQVWQDGFREGWRDAQNEMRSRHG